MNESHQERSQFRKGVEGETRMRNFDEEIQSYNSIELTNRVTGGKFVEQLRSARDPILKKYTKKSILDSEFARALQEFKAIMNNNKYDTRYNFFRTIIDDEKVKQLLFDRGILPHTSIGDDPEDVDDYPYQLLQAFNVGAIPEEIFPFLFEAYVSQFELSAEKFKEAIGPAVEKVMEKIEAAIASGILPLSVESVRERVSVLSFRLVDPIIAETEETGGSYSSESNQIEISASVFNQQSSLMFSDKHFLLMKFEKILTHEMIHAISGRTMLLEKGEDPEGNIKVQRIGARIISSDISRFRWMNEAITEDLTWDISKKSDGEDWNRLEKYLGSYFAERRLLSALRRCGAQEIPSKLFNDAFFENVNSEKSDKRMQSTRALTAVIREAYGDGFLVRLDSFFNQTVGSLRGDRHQRWSKAAEIAAEMIENGRWQEIK